MTVAGLSTLVAGGAMAALPAKSINLDDPNSVSPGILGFLAFFLLAIALYLLVRNMNGHLRRVRYRQEALEAEAAAQAAAAAAQSGETDDKGAGSDPTVSTDATDQPKPTP